MSDDLSSSESTPEQDITRLIVSNGVRLLSADISTLIGELCIAKEALKEKRASAVHLLVFPDGFGLHLDDGIDSTEINHFPSSTTTEPESSK